MIRIAFVTRIFACGGLERCVSRIANHLPPGEFEPTVISFSKNVTASEWIQRDDVRVVSLGGASGIRQRTAALRRLFREQKIDIAHSHNWGTLVETSLATPTLV